MCCAVKYRRSFSKSVSFHYSSQWWDFLCCCCETVSFSFTRTGVMRRLPSFAFVSLNSTRQCSFWSGYKRPCGRQNSITNLSASYTSHLNLYWFTVIWICIEFVQISFKCDLCDGDYVGYTRRQLFLRIEEHKHSAWRTQSKEQRSSGTTYHS